MQADADAFLSALAAWLQVAPGTSVLAEVKTRGQFLLVLDGFERMQSDEPPHEVRDESLRHFLERCAGIGAGAACLCASRLPLTLDAPVRAIALHGLESDDAVALLQARGLPASQDALREVARQYAGHPLTLSLVAGAVGQFPEGEAPRHAELWAKSGLEWLRDSGDLARGERIVRALLERAIRRDLGRLYSDLAVLLDCQGRPSEAIVYLRRAYRAAVRHERWTDACEHLLKWCGNAVLRGRLPLAVRLAERADALVRRYYLAEHQKSSRLYSAYAAHLCSGAQSSCSELWRRKFDEPEAAVAIDVLLRVGIPEVALGMADLRSNHLGWRVSGAADQALFLRQSAFFYSRLHDASWLPSQAAAMILQEGSLDRIAQSSRLEGRRPLLIEVLTLRARLLRLHGQTSGALNDLEEAEDLARRYGLAIHLVNVLLESRHYFCADPVREALEIAARPEVDYRWGAVEARNWLALREAIFDDAAVEAGLQEVMDAVRAVVCAGGEIPKEPAMESVPTITLRGIAPLDRIILVPGPESLSLQMPVEEWLHHEIELLIADDRQLSQRYETLWNTLYEAQMRDREQPGPTYHLAVLLLLEGRILPAATAADDLLASRTPFPGAGNLAAACRHSAKAARDVLLRAEAAEREGTAAVLYATAFNLGHLHEHLGDFDDARRAYRQALHVDWRAPEPRRRLQLIDESVEAREKCRRCLTRAMHAVETWSATVGQYPAALDELARGLMRAAPACPDGGEYLYTTNGDRALFACRRHRLRRDSSQGDLTPRPPVCVPDGETLHFFTAMRAIGEKLRLNETHLRVTRSRGHRSR
ncbi:MAG: tetratricopeptide repeat protein [Armatimonadetes bacterium]|nr:tetratricopeptide repeat protein [Armatimonadota bacterium]